MKTRLKESPGRGKQRPYEFNREKQRPVPMSPRDNAQTAAIDRASSAVPQNASQIGRPPMGGIIWSIVLNAVIPVVLYKVAKGYFSASEFIALVVATAFPLGKSVFDVSRRRRFDPIAIIVLLGIAVDGVAILLGGSPRMLLVRESLFTGAFGVACFVSLLMPRPLMFYIGRYFAAGMDGARQEKFNASWRFPELRFCHRLMTVVWGCVFVGELAARIVLIYTVSAALVLIISPILIGTLTIVTMIWTFSYGNRVRTRMMARVAAAR